MNEDLLRLWPRVEQILDQLDGLPEPDRAARAAVLCEDDPQLRTAVLCVLATEGRVDGFLDTPVSPFDPEFDERPIESLERYRLVRELGRGGMSTVYLAVRSDGEFTQQVAVKLLDSGSFSDIAVERFRRERETLARLNHPNIAQLIDGGVTALGTPYLVMELIDGSRIDEYARSQDLSVEARLQLFVQVCAAVEHAHSQLVVHRDIKPGNVMVDQHGMVKLLDFGIAKWIDQVQQPSDQSLTTTRVLTPGYAAPEQFRGEAATTATDVYQLGLLLYELLSGCRAQVLAESSHEELQRRVLTEDPTPPSVAARAGSDGRQLSRILSGDLDAIVARALRKEPTERYRTVEALRRDIGNYLSQLPVEARRGDWKYRFRKLLRRRRSWISAAAAATVCLLIGLVGVLAQARAAAVERDRARDAETQVAAINDFLINELLQAATPEKAQGREPTVGEVLGNASRAVGPALGSAPAVEAAVRLALSKSYTALGRYAEAREHAAAAAERFAALGDDGALGVLRARTQQIDLALLQGGVAALQPEVEQLIADTQARMGAGDPETISAQLRGARLTLAQGHASAAADLLEQFRGEPALKSPEAWRLRFEWLSTLADARTQQYRAREAEAASGEALELLRAHLGPDHPSSIAALRRVAMALSTQLRWDEALVLHREVLERRQRTAGLEHPDTADAIHDLSVILMRLDRREEARAASERAVEIYQRTLGPDHPRTITALRNRAVMLSQAGYVAEAEQLYQRVIEIRTRSLGPVHPSTINAWRDRMTNLRRSKDEVAARASAAQIISLYGSAAAAASPDPTLLDNFAEFLLDVSPESLRDPNRAHELAQRAVSATGRSQHLPLKTLSRAMAALGVYDGAIATAKEALALPEAIRSWTTEQWLVDLLREHGTAAELESFLLTQLERHRQRRGEDEPLMAKTLRHLAQLHRRLGQLGPAEQRYRESLAQLRKSRDETYWEVARAKSELGELLLDLDRIAEAKPLLLEAEQQLASDPTTSPELLRQARERVERLRLQTDTSHSNS